MTEFTPLASLIGGGLIGLAAVLLMALDGRIAGVSGIAGRILPPFTSGRSPLSALAFIAGLFVAPFAVIYASGQPVAQTVSPNLALMAGAGLLVGFGAAMGNGCTSGHGVCGISRLSPRSIVATLTFMATAILTVFVARHLIGG
ncbi:MAG TPA: YeeE/YedE thiosulfate transporter family protein [Mesorhizobium sp.]|jgi:uncharacterized membrane protein YedE/YeeE